MENLKHQVDAMKSPLTPEQVALCAILVENVDDYILSDFIQPPDREKIKIKTAQNFEATMPPLDGSNQETRNYMASMMATALVELKSRVDKRRPQTGGRRKSRRSRRCRSRRSRRCRSHKSRFFY